MEHPLTQAKLFKQKNLPPPSANSEIVMTEISMEILFWRDMAKRGPWWWISVFCLSSMIGGPIGAFYFALMRELLK
jgi:hypothetical protein